MVPDAAEPEPISLAEGRSAAEPVGAEALFRAHAPFVAGFLMRLGAHPQELDDLCQEVFLIAHKRGGHIAGKARPTTWLAEIALRVLATSRRTRRRSLAEPDHEAIDAAVAPGAGPFEAVAAAQALARVQSALNTLDLDRRAVFVLFELEGESCDAIADGLGIPVGTVYSRLHTARREFERAYERLRGGQREGREAS